MNTRKVIEFPSFSGVRCLMMPYIQGDANSVPQEYEGYADILSSIYLKRGEVGFLTIDESLVTSGLPHRGQRAKYGRALHTEAGVLPERLYVWGGGGWGKSHRVTLNGDVKILLANNLSGSCALWNAEQRETSPDGDIGYLSESFPYASATFMQAGEVHEIGIFTPHESVPVSCNFNRQFLRIISSGIHGREEYFTVNPKVAAPAFADGEK